MGSPTDEEFLESLHDHLKDDDYIDFLGEFSEGDLKKRVDVAKALLCLTASHDEAKTIPVGIVPTRELNACTVRTPRGSHVILLDSGVFLILAMLFRAYMAFYTWNTLKPYCHDHSQAAFGRTILLLAEHCVTGDFGVLARIPTLQCPSLPDYDRAVSNFANLVEIFILLHEYGHAILRHLDSNGVH